ncbi:tigger transposable element-derived protein 1-like [Macrobrachium rosenbergii]|uniref:tigger transposable element-derived protein 1-like n=1 Tax=Macrobrachium rosenbergii TaxID=79674 RepID=UPI0034D6950B
MDGGPDTKAYATQPLDHSNKARLLFEELKKTYVDPHNKYFVAIAGWFHCFKNCHNFHSLKVSSEAASTDARGAAKFEDALRKIIVDKGEKNIPFKILLILDNAPSHPQHIGNINENTKLVFLPQTTSLTEPMDQGTVAAFKAYYLWNTFAQGVQATDNEEKELKTFWKEFNVRNVIMNIGRAWKEILAHGRSLDYEIEEEDIQGLIDVHDVELTTEDLIELAEERKRAEEEEIEEQPEHLRQK